MTNVKIIDAIMGSGKTYDAIERMKCYAKRGEKFIYITPFLNEVQRILDELPVNQISTPLSVEENGGKPVLVITEDLKSDDEGFKMVKEAVILNKRAQFLKMVTEGKNIASTHALFCTLKKSDFDLFSEYVLILDEVVNPLKIENIGNQDIQILKDQDLIVIKEDTSEVKFIKDDYHDSAFKHVKALCEGSTVFCLDKHFFVWLFPIEIFKEFKEVQILTYLFRGSLMAAYFDLFNLDYTIKEKDYSAELLKVKGLLNIYSGVANQTKGSLSMYCMTWCDNASKNTAKKESDKAANILKRVFNTKSDENAFTTFKASKSKFAGAGYTRGFISINARATNDFDHKKSMAYLGNRYFDVQTKNFFSCRGVKVDEDLWALGELIQWIWRGCIRKGEPMNLYIPSLRMRNLLLKWLDGQYIKSEVVDKNSVLPVKKSA